MASSTVRAVGVPSGGLQLMVFPMTRSRRALDSNTDALVVSFRRMLPLTVTEPGNPVEW